MKYLLLSLLPLVASCTVVPHNLHCTGKTVCQTVSVTTETWPDYVD